MRKDLKQRMLATVFATVLVFTSISLPTQAEENTAKNSTTEEGIAEDGITIAGDPETVRLPGSLQDTREMNFNEGWKFYLGTSSSAQTPNFNDSDWDNVTLPHDFSITQSYTTSGEAESGFLPGGTGWYRKTFILPESYASKQLFLNFDGVYSDAYVYVNGTMLGENHYGYTSFAFDITDEVTCDGSTENVIAVKAVNNIPSSRWYSGSGIYRDVTLAATDSIHVDRYGTQVTTPNIGNGDGTVHIETDIVNENESTDAVQVTVKNTVYTRAGEKASDTVESNITVQNGQSVTDTSDVLVGNPALWSVETPNLYYVRTELWVDDTLTDSYETTFGFRYFSFDGTYGFKLNGQNLKLNGVCLHSDQGALGSASYYDAMYRQLSIMKEMGANAVRTSHNPHDRQFMEICNELGLLVLEDCFDGWDLAKNGNRNDFSKYFSVALGADNQVLEGDASMTWGEFAMRSMVKRDRNDPCLFMWSLANEVQEGTSTGASSTFVSIADTLLNILEKEDGTRPATISDNSKSSNSILAQIIQKVTAAGGVAGFNYASGSNYDSLRSTYSVMVGTETSSAVNSRGIYKSQANAANADGNYHLTSYDTSAVSWGLTAHDSMYNVLTRDYVAGEFVWTGFDYLGEPTPWNGTGAGTVSYAGAIPNSSYFGIVETTGFPKDTYYLYRSQWKQDKNTLHLVTAWDSDNMLISNGKTPVVIYSNAPKVELYRSGTLIGTATRTVNTTTAGYQYYTYTTSSDDSSVCEAVSATGSESLYAAFNVVYEKGTISAKAYDENDSLITDVAGNTEVKTPGTANKLDVQVNKTEINADGSSLAYITVDVEDANGVLDTTAANSIQFSLSGNGEIVGVDNGNQATTAKYQQSSVLTSTTEATIAAYAGKALVIVRSTKDAGSFTVDASSSGLNGGSVTVKTNEVDNGELQEGLTSYKIIRDYTVKAGTKPEFKTDAVGIMADETEVAGRVVWDDVTEEIYNTPGDYTVKGSLIFEGEESLAVTCRLHVIGNVVALRNISTATMASVLPALPDKVDGVLADGSLSGEFSVTWDAVSAGSFANVGDIVVVNGTAAVFGTSTLPVTASVRVTETVNTESSNVAPQASGLAQDISADKQSDNLESIKNGTTKPGDNTAERWSNWSNRTTSDTATITFRWDTAQLLSSVNLYYYFDSCAALPEAVSFEYSLDGQTYNAVEATAEMVEEYSLGAEYAYTFEKVINPVALRIVLKQQGGTSGSHCVALTETEIMTYAGKTSYNDSAALSGIQVDGAALSGFAEDTLSYKTNGAVITASSGSNAGITVLPVYENVVRILTISEDGNDMRTYEVELSNTVECTHENTEIQRQIAATCTENGYTGDEKCTVCGAVISEGTIIPATGHTYNSGVVTKEPTENEEGIKLYTCTVCGTTKEEVIPVLSMEKMAPKATLTVKAASAGKITLTGTFEDYENTSKYYEVTAHGLVYYSSSKLGTRNLTVNTAGRTRVNLSKYGADGSFTYIMKPAYASTKYTVRAFLAYKNENGRTIYVYSAPQIVSYNGLK